MIEILNIAVSWGLMVLIWLVQIIIYPAFREIPEANFKNFTVGMRFEYVFLSFP